MLLKLLFDERGQDLAEYGIALAVIAAGAASIALMIATDVQSLWSAAHEAMHPGGSH